MCVCVLRAVHGGRRGSGAYVEGGRRCIAAPSSPCSSSTSPLPASAAPHRLVRVIWRRRAPSLVVFANVLSLCTFLFVLCHRRRCASHVPRLHCVHPLRERNSATPAFTEPSSPSPPPHPLLLFRPCPRRPRPFPSDPVSSASFPPPLLSVYRAGACACVPVNSVCVCLFPLLCIFCVCMYVCVRRCRAPPRPHPHPTPPSSFPPPLHPPHPTPVAGPCPT